VDSPLDYLADSEECYWAVASTLQTDDGPSHRGTVLDIGSGMGYLTYALRKAGYAATGLELNPAAVDAAIARYGPHFRQGNLLDYAENALERFDYVVMTEVIEHVEQARAFVASALRLLSKGGKLIITTPNKTFCREQVLWDTDPPPVHLWWFSEKSLRTLSRELGCEAALMDFSGFRSPYPIPDTEHLPVLTPTRPSVLDRNGRVLPSSRRERSLKRVLRQMLPESVADEIRNMRRRAGSAYSRRPTLCVVLTHPRRPGSPQEQA
jgi:SAM-dependent methyltransferase